MSNRLSEARKAVFRSVKRILPASVVGSIQRVLIEAKPLPINYLSRTSTATSFAVLLPITHKSEPWIIECLDSIKRQSVFEKITSVVLIECTTPQDETKQAIKSFNKEQHRRIRVCAHPGRPWSDLFNHCIMSLREDWFTFLEPCDFVSNMYFEFADRHIAEHPSQSMVLCKPVYYKASLREYSDSHPSKSAFVNTPTDSEWKSNEWFRTTFFRTNAIREHDIQFQDNLSLEFGTELFVQTCFSIIGISNANLSPRSIYYQRVKTDAADYRDEHLGQEQEIQARIECLRSMLLHNNGASEEARSSTMRFIAKEVCNILAPHVSHSVCESNGKPSTHIDSNLKQILDVIPPKTWVKLGHDAKLRDLCHCCIPHVSSQHFGPQHVQLRNIDLAEQQLLFDYYAPLQPAMEVRCTLSKIIEKRVPVYFNNILIAERIFSWHSYTSLDDIIVFFDSKGTKSNISVNGKVFESGVHASTLIREFTRKWDSYAPTRNEWIIMDRDTQADDNGEHFYRYMMKSHPEVKCYFALRKDSPDWRRLHREGFRLLNFGSMKHQRILRRCKKIISSHADSYVHSFFGDNYYHSKDYVFLQHGVLKDDLSNWLNEKPIDLFITSTESERNSVIANGSPYFFTKKEVKLTGLPRHDNLLASDREGKDTIAIMPTWRRDIMGTQVGKGNSRKLNPHFANTRFCTAWENALFDPRLEHIAQQGTKIVFYPHANIAPYVSSGYMKLPDWITFSFDDGSRSIQRLFQDACLLVTDYSSTAFEMAYLEQPVIYYQFDTDSIYDGSHIYQHGYFDYETDGFGPVTHSADELVEAIMAYSASGFMNPEPYRTRANKAFPFRDGKCCERVFQAITSSQRMEANSSLCIDTN